MERGRKQLRDLGIHQRPGTLVVLGLRVLWPQAGLLWSEGYAVLLLRGSVLEGGFQIRALKELTSCHSGFFHSPLNLTRAESSTPMVS